MAASERPPPSISGNRSRPVVRPQSCAREAALSAVVMMIASAIPLETAMPTSVSILMRFVSSASLWGSRLSGLLSGSIRCSSASFEDCQTKRYGEIIVLGDQGRQERAAPLDLGDQQ